MPTIVELQETISNDIRTRLGVTDTRLQKTIDALSIVLSGQFKLMYLRLFDTQQQLFPDTADEAINGGELDRLGQLHLNRGKFQPTAGVYTIKLDGVVNSSLRAGITFKSNEDAQSPGELYVLDTEYILSGTDDLIEIRSLELGADFLLSVGDELTITEPVIGIDQSVVVVSVVQQPIEGETTEAYRRAILQSLQLEPQGGSRTDYIIWSNDAQGVRRVYPYVSEERAGVVQIYVEATESASEDGLGTPTDAILQDVVSVVNIDPLTGLNRRPLLDVVEVLPINLNPVDITVTGLQIDSASIRFSIRENINDFLRTIRPFVAGGELIENKNDVLFTARLQSVVTDVLSAGNFFTQFSVSVNGVSVISSLFSRENIPFLRNLNFN